MTIKFIDIEGLGELMIDTEKNVIWMDRIIRGRNEKHPYQMKIRDLYDDEWSDGSKVEYEPVYDLVD